MRAGPLLIRSPSPGRPTAALPLVTMQRRVSRARSRRLAPDPAIYRLGLMSALAGRSHPHAGYVGTRRTPEAAGSPSPAGRLVPASPELSSDPRFAPSVVPSPMLSPRGQGADRCDL